MRKYKKQNKRYKKRRNWGKGLLGRNRSSWTPLYLSKNKQKGGFVSLAAALAVPFIAKLFT